MKKHRTYPFAPKSARVLLPGEFWAIPLADGTFACGQVVQPAPGTPGSSRVLFLAGLLSWRSIAPPTSETIKSSTCMAQGKLHYEAIAHVGGQILGCRSIGVVEPWLFRSAEEPKGSQVLRGLFPLRAQKPTDVELPVIQVWGYDIPRLWAEKRLPSPAA